MSRIIDITDKLNFEEKPQIRFKDCTAVINNDAPTVLKVIAIYSDEGDRLSAGAINTLYELLFDKSEREKIDAQKLDIDDFITLIYSAAENLIGSGEGEAPTPAMT